MPGSLALPSLEIHNFRGLRELKIARLGRANLIVGKNNVGKTSVLEALRLYSQPGSVQTLLELLRERDESVVKSLPRGEKRNSYRMLVEGLYFGRPSFGTEIDPITIGLTDRGEATLSIKVRVGSRTSVGEGRPISPPTNSDDSETDFDRALQLVFSNGSRGIVLPIADESELERFRQIQELGSSMLAWGIPSCFVGANGLRPVQLEKLWDAVALTPLQDEVESSLRLVSHEVSKIGLIADAGAMADRIPIVRLTNEQRPVPLRSLGDGVNRMFGIALALANAGGGILLLDEVENGLHYSVLADIWSFIFRIAARSNVQVFATTHSSDCVTAFQAAASESEEDGVVVHLGRRGDAIVATEFDKASLEIAVEVGMELRG